jgi:hypothetical protein
MGRATEAIEINGFQVSFIVHKKRGKSRSMKLCTRLIPLYTAMMMIIINNNFFSSASFSPSNTYAQTKIETSLLIAEKTIFPFLFSFVLLFLFYVGLSPLHTFCSIMYVLYWYACWINFCYPYYFLLIFAVRAFVAPFDVCMHVFTYVYICALYMYLLAVRIYILRMTKRSFLKWSFVCLKTKPCSFDLQKRKKNLNMYIIS